MKILITTAVLLISFIFSKAQNVFPANGSVGIGTTSPSTGLHILKHTTSLNIANFITIDNRGSNPTTPNVGYTTPHVIGGLLFAAYRDVRIPSNGAGIWAYRNSYVGGLSSGVDIVFGAMGNGTNISSDNALPTERMRITWDGNVGIGTSDPKGYMLAVAGDVVAQRIVVKQQANWPDYVFEPTYQLPSLQSVEKYILFNKHLPDVPSAATIEKDGIDLGENQALLLKKIEELTLYVIEQDKKQKQQQEEIKSLKYALVELVKCK